MAKSDADGRLTRLPGARWEPSAFVGSRTRFAAVSNQHGQFQIGVTGKREGDLLVTQEAVRRVIERAFAAFPVKDAMFVPEPRKVLAFAM
jgi:hypothetical protein